MSVEADPFIPVHGGRTARFVAELKLTPGEWRRYPYPLTSVAVCRSRYAARYPGTEWASDADGTLGARWVGDTS